MDAMYHRENNDSMQLTVLKTNEDGTVNLGTKDKVEIVTNCPVVDGQVFGSCTLIKAATKAETKG